MKAGTGSIEGERHADAASGLSGAQATDMVIQVAHDLRSPLSSILVLAEALQNGQFGNVTPAQRTQLGLIYAAARSLCSTANDLLEMAHGGTAILDEQPAPFSVRDVLDAVSDIVRPMLHERNLELRIVGPTLDRRRGRAGMIKRVLLNLTTNAIRSTASGHIEIAVREMEAGPRRVECSVRDTGCGLDPLALRSIFGGKGVPCGRVSDASSTGLGLGVCKRLVSALGSTLEVETRRHVGTRFSFDLRLPLALPEA